jgi:hypothetical protein
MGSIIKWPGLISLQEDIATTKDFINEYQEGKITRDRFRACINAVYQVHNWAQLVPRIIFEAKKDANAIIKLGLIDEKTLTYYSQKTNMQKLRAELKELSEVLKEARVLQKR